MLRIFLKNLPKWITASTLILLIWLFVKYSFFDRQLEFFPFAHEVGKIFEALSLSYIASYIFYLVVVHYKETKEKYELIPFALKSSNLIISTVQVELSHILKTSGTAPKIESVSEDAVKSAMTEINASERNAPIHFPENGTIIVGNWLEYFRFNSTKQINLIEKVLANKAPLEADWIKILMDIENTGFINIFYNMPNTGHSDLNIPTPLGQYSDCYIEYLNHCKELCRYIKQVESEYTNRM